MMNALPTTIKRLLLISVSILALLLGFGANWLLEKNNGHSLPELQTATVLLNQEKPLPEFMLTDQEGSPFDKKRLTGRWSFIFFGYTHCPDVCPTTLSTLKETSQIIQNNEDSDNAQVLFVSVDPNRDTPEQLKKYVTYFNPEFIGITGNKDALDTLTSNLGIVYARVPNPDNSDNYLVDHSASILLIDPLNRLVALFGAPHDAVVIADDFQQIRHYYEGLES